MSIIATMPAPICPCCPHELLRHIRATGIYWFCPHCYQEMPTLEQEELKCLKDERKLVETLAARFLEAGKFEVVATNSNRNRQQKNSRVRGEKSKVIMTSKI